MKLSAASRNIAKKFLANGQLPTKGRSELDGPNSRLSDIQLSRRMDNYVALDMERIRGDEDERWGVVVHRPEADGPKVKVYLGGDAQDGGFSSVVEKENEVNAEFVQFTPGAVRRVVVRESAEGVQFFADHHDRESRDSGYAQSHSQLKS